MNSKETRRPSMDPNWSTPEDAADPEVAAKELFAHGLLQAHYRENEGDTNRRVRRLMDAIDADVHARHQASSPARSMSFEVHAAKLSRWRSLRFATGLAAAMTLIAVLAIEFTPTNTALAAVQASVEASKSAGDRRYSVKVQSQRDAGEEFTKIATLDVRDPEHVVIKAKTPQGHRVTVGRSPEGVWAIRPDGTIDRYAPRSAMPRWVNFGSNTIVLESVDDLMTQLAKDYTLTRGEADALPGSSAAKLDRITANIKKEKIGPEPERVELWLDSASRVVKRLELHWPEFSALGTERVADGERDGPPEGAGGPPRHRRGPGCPEGRPGNVRKGEDERAPRPPMDGARPGEQEPRMEGERDALHEEQGPQADGEESRRGPEDRPGVRGPGPERRFGHEGEMRGPRAPMGPGGPMSGPRGPMGGPRDGGRGPMSGPPQFLGERPDFRRGGPGGPPPPPRVMVFELEDGAVFAEGWFEPEAHAEK